MKEPVARKSIEISPQDDNIAESSESSDTKTPIERLVQSISSDEQWTVDEGREDEKNDNLGIGMTRTDRPYHDPTKPSMPERDDPVFDHDSHDEINLSPKTVPDKDDDNKHANFTPVMLYRFLFGKSPKERISSVKSQQSPEISEEREPEENPAEEEMPAENLPEEMELVSGDTGEVKLESPSEENTKQDIAENVTILLVAKLKAILPGESKKSKDKTPANDARANDESASEDDNSTEEGQKKQHPSEQRPVESDSEAAANDHSTQDADGAEGNDILNVEVVEESSTYDAEVSDENSTIKEDTEKEKAENLPVFLASKLRKLLRPSRTAAVVHQCPLCGQKITPETFSQITSGEKHVKLWRLQAVTEGCRLASDLPSGRYRTEIRVEADGTTSTSESYYRIIE